MARNVSRNVNAEMALFAADLTVAVLVLENGKESIATKVGRRILSSTESVSL